MNRRETGSMTNGLSARLRLAPLLPILALSACASAMASQA